MEDEGFKESYMIWTTNEYMHIFPSFWSLYYNFMNENGKNFFETLSTHYIWKLSRTDNKVFLNFYLLDETILSYVRKIKENFNQMKFFNIGVNRDSELLVRGDWSIEFSTLLSDEEIKRIEKTTFISDKSTHYGSTADLNAWFATYLQNNDGTLDWIKFDFSGADGDLIDILREKGNDKVKFTNCINVENILANFENNNDEEYDSECTNDSEIA